MAGNQSGGAPPQGGGVYGSPGTYSSSPSITREDFALLHNKADPGKRDDVRRILENLGTQFTMSELETSANLGGLSKRSMRAYNSVLEGLRAQQQQQQKQNPNSTRPSFAPPSQIATSGGASSLQSAFSPQAANQLLQFYHPARQNVYGLMGYSPEQSSAMAGGYDTSNQIINPTRTMLENTINTPYLRSLYGLPQNSTTTPGIR